MVTDSRLLRVSLRDGARGFVISLNASRRYSPRYISSLEEALALLSDFAETNSWPAVDAVTTEHIETYLVYLGGRPRWFGERDEAAKRPVSSSTLETHYRRIKRFFYWLVDRGHIEANPLDLIPHPEPEEREVMPLSDKEQAALVKLSDPKLYNGKWRRWRAVRNRAALFLFLDTPGRRDEIGAMKVMDIDQQTGEVKVMGKGRKERWMALGAKVQESLWEYLVLRDGVVGGRHDGLWVEPSGRRMQPQWVYLMLKRLGVRAGVVDFHTHRTRHNFTVRAIRGGMPIPVLEREGGWKRIPATYLKTIGREDQVRFHREVSPLDTMDAGQAWAPHQGRKRRGRL